MEYVKPTLALFGSAMDRVLGSSISPEEDSDVGDTPDLDKPPDISAGLDD